MKSQVMPQLMVTPPVGAALRRVATLVARATPPEKLFSTVTEEAGRLLSADLTVLTRYDCGTQTLVAGWSRNGTFGDPGSPVRLSGNLAACMSAALPRPRTGNSEAAGGPLAAARGRGFRGCAGAPVKVQGRLWGVMCAASAGKEPLPAGTEARLAEFTQLVAAAIGNADAQAELMAARARIVAAVDETRRRIERDLHDGAQQRLVSLGLRLLAAQAAVPAGLEGLRAELGQVAAGLMSTLDELREYARGIHPAILFEGGLAAALKTLARRSPVPVRLDVGTKARLPERVEVAAYYVVSEALTNAARHANASAVDVAVTEADGIVRLSVSDDGVGGADPARGSGLAGLKDRVAAIGGTLLVDSRPGAGTHIVAELPAPSPLARGGGEQA